jgi:hypothetical protein
VPDGAVFKAGQVMFEVSGELSVDDHITAPLATRRSGLRQWLDQNILQLTELGAAFDTQRRMVEARIATHCGAIITPLNLVRCGQAFFRSGRHVNRQ